MTGHSGRTLALALLLTTTVLTGCLDTADPTTGTPVSDVASGEGWPAGIAFDGPATVAELVGFVKTHSHRNYDGPQHQSAREYLAGELEALGLEVVRQGFDDPTTVPFAGAEAPAPVYLENIVGIQWGTDRDTWVVVGGHYDTVAAAVEGAYDDGSGTMLTLNLARALAGVETERTIAYVMFDGEERGLKGSRYFSDSITAAFDDVDAEPFVYQPELFAMVDLDMIGINWPATPPIVFDDNSPEVRAYVVARAAELGIPEDKLECRGITAGRSDYASFEDAGIPVAFFISDFDDVWYQEYQVPRTYPFWHQVDTVETMETMAGGRDTLEAGFQTALDLSGGLLYFLADEAGLALTVETDEQAPPPRC